VVRQGIATVSLRVFAPHCLAALLLFTTAFGATRGPDWTDWLGPQGFPRLRARLRDEPQNAEKHMASVEVEVQNIWLNLPDAVPIAEAPAGALEYEVDHCPPVLTADTRIRFQQLTPGSHLITVGLLGSDNQLLAPRAKLEVTIP